MRKFNILIGMLIVGIVFTSCSGDNSSGYRAGNTPVNSSLVQSSVNQTIMEMMTFTLKLREDLSHDKEFYDEPLIDETYLEHAKERVDELSDQLIGYDATDSKKNMQKGMYQLTIDLKEIVDELEEWQEEYPKSESISRVERFDEFIFRLDEVYSDLTGYFGLSK